jgi:hypothetical protein
MIRESIAGNESQVLQLRYLNLGFSLPTAHPWLEVSPRILAAASGQHELTAIAYHWAGMKPVEPVRSNAHGKHWQ